MPSMVEARLNKIEGLLRVLLTRTQIWLAGASGALYYNGGNVGIGTTGPAQKLDVSGSIVVGNNEQVQWRGSAGVLSSIRTVGTSDLTLRSGGIDTMTITGGNVGIGTTSPTQMLSVGASNQFTASSTGGVLATDYSGGQAYISTYYGRASSVDTNIGSLNNHNIVLTPNGTGNIQMSGNVGIGNTNPQDVLDVTGDIRCSGKFSSAGTDGITGTLTTADLVGKTLTFTNGIITGYA